MNTFLSRALAPAHHFHDNVFPSVRGKSTSLRVARVPTDAETVAYSIARKRRRGWTCLYRVFCWREPA